MSLLESIKRARPGSFVDGRTALVKENAIAYRTRQPIIGDVNEIPMVQDFGIFRVSSIMCGRTQVAVCVRFRQEVLAHVTRGDHAAFLSPKAAKDPGEARTAMKTSDYLIFDYSSRGALLLKKLAKGRGYGVQ